MKKLTPMVISFLCLIACIEAPPARAQRENIEFGLSTDWQLASNSETHDATIMEFVRKGDDINNWKELVTFQNFARKGALAPRGAMPSPGDFLNTQKALREKECPGLTQWNTIAQDENSIVYEWQAKPCAGWPEQHEMAKIVYGHYNIFILHYAAKVHELTPDTRAKWIKTFSTFNISVGGQALHFVSDTVDVVVPFAADKVMAALVPAMESVSCHVTKATSKRIECNRPRSGYGTKTASGGESVTAVLAADGNNTHVHISTGKGFYGRLVKEDWSVPIYEAVMKALEQPQPQL
jgi:hypothetical protein